MTFTEILILGVGVACWYELRTLTSKVVVKENKAKTLKEQNDKLNKEIKQLQFEKNVAKESKEFEGTVFG